MIDFGKCKERNYNSKIFNELGPLARFSHRVAMSVPGSVRLFVPSDAFFRPLIGPEVSSHASHWSSLPPLKTWKLANSEAPPPKKKMSPLFFVNGK